ncbi:hypothetical protein K7X08_006948 [Anisodus acutangulus]|uniref:Pentatricopeptide repeat-containing protein n=1 Tax=Anisodus acutangulus TaxID=402998 RepID=A0A9Q1LEG1_9SOLA|nr:hypothetical protein K7X08_006948 [Anisodus acutangulus]
MLRVKNSKAPISAPPLANTATCGHHRQDVGMIRIGVEFCRVINPVPVHHQKERKKDDQTHFALALYTRILTQTTRIPNSYTYPSLFKACSSQPWLQHGRALHTHVLKFLELPYDHFVQASLLNFYSKCGELGVSRFLFDQITKPDLASWNSILTAYAHNTSVEYEASPDNAYDSTNLSLEALLLFSQMQKSLTRPNEVSVVALISSCADVGALSQGLWAHSYVLSNGLKLNRSNVVFRLNQLPKYG